MTRGTKGVLWIGGRRAASRAWRSVATDSELCGYREPDALANVRTPPSGAQRRKGPLSPEQVLWNRWSARELVVLGRGWTGDTGT